MRAVTIALALVVAAVPTNAGTYEVHAQRDDTTSAGFSTKSTPFLKVNPDYLTKEADVSHYKNVLPKAIALLNAKIVSEGNLIVEALTEDVVAFARTLDGFEPIVVLINRNTTDVTVSLDLFLPGTNQYEVLIADINSGVNVGDRFNSSSVTAPARSTVMLQGIDTSTDDESD